ncbi:hypothetical protein FXO38_32523 [Capsicum annuum]|nr:hypothetical protein FXO38_32523 [Capsicum annuum]KAF3633010.1 hypothetical protein FXO37_27237 [Capsicum annuum]
MKSLTAKVPDETLHVADEFLEILNRLGGRGADCSSSLPCMSVNISQLLVGFCLVNAFQTTNSQLLFYLLMGYYEPIAWFQGQATDVDLMQKDVKNVKVELVILKISAKLSACLL